MKPEVNLREFVYSSLVDLLFQSQYRLDLTSLNIQRKKYDEKSDQERLNVKRGETSRIKECLIWMITVSFYFIRWFYA